MRDVSIWRGLLGVENTIIERVEFEEYEQLLVAHVRPTSRLRGRCGTAVGAVPAMTAGPVVGGGERWTWARCGRCSRPNRRGCGVANMA